MSAAQAKHLEIAADIPAEIGGASLARSLRDTLDRFVGSSDLVLVWGVPSLDTPDLDRLLCDAGRSVGVAAEAGAGDVADLCATVLGRRAS